MQGLSRSMQEGQQTASGLYESIEVSLQMASRAETWAWTETPTGDTPGPVE
jgi:hypothetical protein